MDGLGKSLSEIGLTTQELHRDMTGRNIYPWKKELSLFYMKAKNQDAFYHWLSPCEYESHHLDQGEGILENTGTWLFDMNTQFQNWQSSKGSSVLWVRGDSPFDLFLFRTIYEPFLTLFRPIAGVGKTRLT